MRALRFAAMATAIVCLAGPAATEEVPAQAPVWAPVASERLVRLPAGYLEKAVERDFRDSPLAAAMEEHASALEGSAASLAELQAAAESARGPIRDDLRHQFLVAKQDYVSLMGARQDLDRQRVDTRLRLFRRLLARIERAGDPGSDPELAVLVERRTAALKRFEGTTGAVDMKLFAASAAQESRYAQEYRRHATAVEDLVRAIDAHPMNAAPVVDGRSVGKADYLRHLIAAAETDAALLDQKDLVLAYMAKLVALDAMALADEVDGARDPEDAGGDLRDVTAAVEFFTAPN